MFDTILIFVLVCLAVNYLLDIIRRQVAGIETKGAMVPNTAPVTAPLPDIEPVPEMETNQQQQIFYLQGNHILPNEVVENLQEDITQIRHVFTQVAVARLQDAWT